MNDMGLRAKDIHKIYKNGLKEVRAVNGVSLEIKKGSSLAIVGPSGAGKSTLLHLLGGLDKPTSGNITLDGVDIYRLSDKERARIRNQRIGFVFQFYHLLPEFSALENVMLPGLINGQGPRSRGQGAKKRARHILKAVGLEDRTNHRPGELSGGESQRVAIARALVNEPEILLCDEPTGNFDSKTSVSIYGLLLDLKSKTGMVLVVVTHDERISSRIGHIIRIKDGMITDR
ncbi:MAG: ABC transporter ATP-binding protein [Candidatus Omnitrophica bacterium]|nr:ABC transporter ATP-binding protein [Candidatus Omnitrophota bacterium]